MRSRAAARGSVKVALGPVHARRYAGGEYAVPNEFRKRRVQQEKWRRQNGRLAAVLPAPQTYPRPDTSAFYQQGRRGSTVI